MKSTTLFSGIVIALLLSIISSPLLALASVFFNPLTAMQLTLALIATGYLIYLFSKANLRAGKIFLPLLSFSVLIGALFFKLTFFSLLLIMAATIWLVRSVINYKSVISTIVDGALVCLGFGSALLATFFTGSLFVAVWSFLLLQALYVFIPRSFLTKEKHCSELSDSSTHGDPFAKSQHAAEEALRRLALGNVG
ncbi:MAG: hypothetical protein IT291_03795 [Deltaproteobacteria bacterium]|nr:hypothetical protein [Deltaproteobacteria bacterium]